MPRRTVVLLVVVAVVVALLYGGSVAAGSSDKGSSSDAVDTWSARLDGIGGTEVGSSDLQLAPPCSLQPGQVLRFAGTCAVDVPAVGGFPLSGLTRRLTMQTTSGTVGLRTSVRGVDLDQALDLGTRSRLAVGRAPATVRLTCAPAVQPCTVQLG